MSRRTRGFGRLKLVAAFLLVAVLLPKFLSINATDGLGSFAEGETGIKLCAIINGGSEEALRFYVYNDQEFETDVIVPKNTCKNIRTEAAAYVITQYLAQEYTLDSVTGGTVSDDSTTFIATSAGQYSIIYTNSYAQKPYLHNFGYTGSNNGATAVEVTFDANGGAGTMAPQRFGLNSQQALTNNAFTRAYYDFNGWNTAADGSGDSYTNGQDMTFATGGEFKLYAQWLEHPVAANVVSAQANNLGNYEIDFSRASVVSDVVETANGNGVNAFTENGETVYYYRGEIENNNVIWANKCWKIVRTTATGGTKMIYNGEPNNLGQCVATGTDTQITYNGQNTFEFNTISSDSAPSPADVGYAYGTRHLSRLENIDTSFYGATYAGEDVEYDNETGMYTLKNAVYISEWGTESNLAIINGHHYFCEGDGLTCERAFYLIGAGDNQTQHLVELFDLTGGADIDDIKAQMYANTNDSVAKATLEAWFEEEGLDDHEDDLEDVVYCNDRSFYGGPLKSITDNYYLEDDAITAIYNIHSYYSRLMDFENQTIAYNPSLECANKNDSFTKDDTVNGNAGLAHKAGLITADEAVLAGLILDDAVSTAYLYTGQNYWTATPLAYALGEIPVALVSGNIIVRMPNDLAGIRPMVSLKAGTHFANGGTGTATNPYVVE